MRSLKFRAWWKDTKRFLDCDEWYMTCSGAKYLHYAVMPYKDDNFIIEQYTGLKDKNGQKIFEGDIVKVNDDFDKYGLNAGEIYEVYFNAGGFRCKHKYESSIARGDKGFWIDDGNDYEVIGNIHENPELLEVKDVD